MIKNILKLLAGFLIGSLIGLIGAGAIVVIFKGVSVSDYMESLVSSDWREGLQVMGFMVLWMIVSSVLHIIIHEGGHLVAGLLTGYRFVSFRVFSLTLVKIDGHFRFRRFSIGGTGGQCLMSPPDRPLSEINTRWYNLGGVLANLIVAAAALAVLCLADLPMWAETLMLMLIIIGVIYALLNGLPLKINGLPNDGYNLKNLEKSSLSKLLFCNVLRANACVQEGMQPKDLPEAYFTISEEIDWTDGMQVNWQLLNIARLQNMHLWTEAYTLLSEALQHKEDVPDLFYKESACEMIFVSLVLGRKDEARQLYTDDIKKYIKDYGKMQSGKLRLLYAISLLLEEDKAKAETLLHTLKSQRNSYLLQGEADMDIELAEWLSKR